MLNIMTTLQFDVIMIIIWLVLVIGCLVLEAITTEVVSIYFSFGALVSMILSITGIFSFWPQLWVFILVSFVTLITTRPLFLKYIKTNEVKTNADALVGKRFKLLKDITQEQRGEVNINGVIWSAITNDNTSIDKDSTIEVLSLDGSKLIVKKI